MNRKLKYAIFGLTIVALSFYAYKYYNKEEKTYIKETVKYGTVENTVIATGKLAAAKEVLVGAQVSGQIEKLHVVLGQKIKKGDMIAEINSVAQNNVLKDNQARLENFQAQLTSAEIANQRAKIELGRQEKMIKDEATSEAELIDARVNVAASIANIEQIKTQIEQTKISLDTARLNVSFTEIRSPINGVVVSITVSQGQTVNANQTSPTIVKIAQLDKMLVRAEIPEGDVTKITPNTEVYFNILGNEDKKYYSKLQSIDPGPQDYSDGLNTNSTSASTNTGKAIYYYGTFIVDNPENILRIAMTAQVTMVFGKVDNVLTIPAYAITKKDGKNTVTLIDNENKETEVEIELGLNNSVLAEVKSGLKEGDVVLLGKADENSETYMPQRLRTK